MKKIEKLTPDQEAKVAEARKHYFEFATCTEPADRIEAEAAARELAEIAGVKISSVVWVKSPEEGKARYNAAWDSLRDSLGDSLRDSLRASLWASLGDSLWDSLWDSLGDSLRASLRDSLGDSLRDSLWDSLGDSLWDSLWASLRASLRDSLGDSLRDSLRDSLGDSLRDTGWLAFYAVPRDILGVVYAEEAVRKLDLMLTTLKSCFAFWIVPGTIILCERPASVEIKDGNLVGLTWRK